MLSESERQRAVEILLEAQRSKKPCLQLTKTFPHIEIEDSYAISSAMAQLRVREQGQKIIGHKVGLTSKAMQASSQIDEPDYGYIFDDMLHSNGVELQHADFCVPRVEPELTFVLKSPLTRSGGQPAGRNPRHRVRHPLHRSHRRSSAKSAPDLRHRG